MCFHKNGFPKRFIERILYYLVKTQKQRKAAHENKKNDESGVVVVAAASQPFVGPIADTTLTVSILSMTPPSVDDSLTVLSHLSIPKPVDYKGNQEKA
ncbi:unnamed protein product [Prunus armeniaca]